MIPLVSWQSPGLRTTAFSSLPLSYGYAKIFAISYSAASIFSAPAAFTSIVVSVHYLCVIIRSMSLSGLLPAYFAKSYGSKHIPSYSLILISCSVVAFTTVLLCGVILYPVLTKAALVFASYCLHFNCFSLFASYIMFRNYYPSAKRGFVSPLGTVGAYLGICVFVFLPFLNNFPWSKYYITSTTCFFGLLLLLSVFYIRFMIQYQKYSPEEERIFFVAFIIRGNVSMLILVFYFLWSLTSSIVRF